MPGPKEAARRRGAPRGLALPRAVLAAAGLAVGLAGAGAWASDGGGDAARAVSRLAPLAPYSLLLDGARAGRRLVVVGERGHVLLSDDLGASWRQVVVPTRATLTAVTFPSPTHGYAVGHDAVVLATVDAGESWTLQHADPELESPLLDVWFADPQRGFAVGAYGLFLETADGGASWRSRMISDRDLHHNAIAATRDGTLFVAGEAGSLLRSRDHGATWQPVSTPHAASLFGALGLADGDLLVFGLQGRAWRTGDGGESWQRVRTGTNASLMGGAVGQDGRLVLGGVTGVVVVGDERTSRLTLRRRPDRKAVATALPLPDGEGMLLLGAFGVAQAGGLASGQEPDSGLAGAR